MSLVQGETPLHWAAEKGHPEAVKCLLEWKASMVAKNGSGTSAFGGWFLPRPRREFQAREKFSSVLELTNFGSQKLGHPQNHSV